MGRYEFPMQFNHYGHYEHYRVGGGGLCGACAYGISGIPAFHDAAGSPAGQ